MPWSTISFIKTDDGVIAHGHYSVLAAGVLENIGFLPDQYSGSHFIPAAPERQQGLIRESIKSLADANIARPDKEKSMAQLASAITKIRNTEDVGTLINAVVDHSNNHLEEALEGATDTLRRLSPDSGPLRALEASVTRLRGAITEILDVAELLSSRGSEPSQQHPSLGRTLNPRPAATPPPSPPSAPGTSASRGR